MLSAALWWAYFDVASLVAERRLRAARPGREQNTLARDSYSYLHLLLMAGIVLVALGSKKVIAHTDEPLKAVPAIALCGGVALYLAGHVLFRLRGLGSAEPPAGAGGRCWRRRSSPWPWRSTPWWPCPWWRR